MKINGEEYRSVWPSKAKDARGHSKWIEIIDQQRLPGEFVEKQLMDGDDVAQSILDLEVCGAGLIGSTAAWGVYLDIRKAPPVLQGERLQAYIVQKGEHIASQRPTAVNLRWAVDRVLNAMSAAPSLEAKTEIAWRVANDIWNEDAQMCDDIGKHTLPIIEDIYARKLHEATVKGLDRSKVRVNGMTLCNAGALAFVDGGTATAGVYQAHEAGIPIHMWVNRTPPKYQGAKMTASELDWAGVPYTIIVNSAAGYHMQLGNVDFCIVGTDRTLCSGYVANKIGTYMLALAARDNDVPFLVGVPDSSFDFDHRDPSEVEIEERNPAEVHYVEGWIKGESRLVNIKPETPGIVYVPGYKGRVRITPDDAKAANPAFDWTRPELVLGLVTPRGMIRPDELSIREHYNRLKH